MIRKIIDNFSLEQICRSGQCFRMSRIGDGSYKIIANDQYIEVRQRGKECEFFCDEQEFADFWENYFDLKTDYSACIARISPNDDYLKNAAAVGSGIRILRQDLWEMMVTFLISQQNNLPRIRRCIQNICEAYGEKKVNSEGKEYCAFPRPEALAGLSEDALRTCNLGYRSKYVVRCARDVVSGASDREKISGMDYQQARKELLKLFGVGEKVADCVCLFGLHHLQAFPVDTHISQALAQYYAEGFPHSRYHDIQGVLQQYIFYFEINGL